MLESMEQLPKNWNEGKMKTQKEKKKQKTGGFTRYLLICNRSGNSISTLTLPEYRKRRKMYVLF